MTERHTIVARTIPRDGAAAGAAAWRGAADASGARRRKNELVFVGFGGSYQEGQTKALFEPFEKETGIKMSRPLASTWPSCAPRCSRRTSSGT